MTVKNVFKNGSLYGLKTDVSDEQFFSGKMVIATGAGPGRTLQRGLLPKDTSSANAIEDRILSYSDVLNDTTAERIRDKTVFIYGGGPTAAWAMEVATKIGKSSVWVGKDFNAAAGAGPRVKDIIDTTGESRAKGRIESISWQATDPASDDPRILVNIIQNNENGSFEKRAFSVDYLVRCTGQDSYEKGGLHDVLSLDIKNDLVPIFDQNQMSGKPEAVLAFGTKNRDLEIIGAAAAGYYDVDRGLKSGPAVSESLPTGGRIGATIGGVVSSVSALTNHMPISQNPKSGDIAVTGLNLNVMNATQLAVYFTGAYPEAAASKINKAVQNLLAERSKTPFGVTDEHLHKLESSHFGETGRQSSADLTVAAREVDSATQTGRSRDRDRHRSQSSGR